MLSVVLSGLLPLVAVSASADLARAEALAAGEDYEGAIDVLFRVIDDCAASEADVGRAYLTLGWAESALGRDDDARRSFAEALLHDKGATLAASAPERSRALLDTVRREGGRPWGAGKLIFDVAPTAPVEVDGRRVATPVEIPAPYGRVVVLTNPPVAVDLACRRLGTTRVTFFRAEAMRVDDSGNVALVATGATLAGMGAVLGIVALAVYDPVDPEASAVLGITGGAFLVAGAIPLGIAGINYANAPPVAHMARVQPPRGESYELLYDSATGLPR